MKKYLKENYGLFIPPVLIGLTFVFPWAVNVLIGYLIFSCFMSAIVIGFFTWLRETVKKMYPWERGGAEEIKFNATLEKTKKFNFSDVATITYLIFYLIQGWYGCFAMHACIFISFRVYFYFFKLPPLTKE